MPHHIACVEKFTLPYLRPVEALYDPDGSHVATVSAATEVGGRLFLGNLGGRGVSVLQL